MGRSGEDEGRPGSLGLVHLNVLSRSLFHGELAASASNDFERSTGFQELKAVAERAFLANHREGLYVSCGQREFQANHFAHRHFDAQQGRYPRFTDVDRRASNHWTLARIDADVDFYLEPTMAPRIHRFLSLASSQGFQRGARPEQSYAGRNLSWLTIQSASNPAVMQAQCPCLVIGVGSHKP